MITKHIQRCPKCADSRKKSGLATCSVLEFPTGKSYLCFHCGYREFKFGGEPIEKTDTTEEIDVKEYLEIPEGELPYNDPETIWHKYYIDNKHMLLIARKGSGDNKKIRPFSLTDIGWVMTVPPGKTLYNSQNFHDDNRPVLVVEGEKAADAAQLLFKNWDVTTWRGGANNTQNGDWDLLKNRKVVLWPDNDAPGVVAMNKVADSIVSAELYIVDVSSLPLKADIADLIGNTDKIKELLQNKQQLKADLFAGEFDPTTLQELHSTDIKYTPFGYASMDRYVQLPPTGVVVISGRTNHGKTAFMINTALNIARHTDKTVLYLSLEFPVEELNLRMVKTLDGGKYSDSGWEDDTHFNNAIKNLSTPAAKEYHDLLLRRKLRLADSNVRISEILKVMDRCAELGKELIIFVDYLQIIPLEGNVKARYEKLKDMIEIMRETANKNRQLLVGGSQLTSGESPFMDTVRESKDLENTAALHLKVWNKSKARNKVEQEYYNEIPGEIVVVVEKSRQNGANGKVFGFNSVNGCVLTPAAITEHQEF